MRLPRVTSLCWKRSPPAPCSSARTAARRQAAIAATSSATPCWCWRSSPAGCSLRKTFAPGESLPPEVEAAVEQVLGEALEAKPGSGWRSAPDDGLHGRDRRAPGSGHVQVRDDGEPRHPRLLLAQDGVFTDLGEEPLAELRLGLHHAASNEIGAGVGEVRGNGEESTDGHRLLLEDPSRQGVSP